MKKMLLSAAAFAVVAVSAVAVAPTTSEAVPAFARQTGAACLSCHFQAIPRLTAFGRSFKIGGFRDMGEQALLEDDHLSMPAVFNASLLFKARINFTNKGLNAVGGAKGFGGLDSSGIQWPDEAALLIGGRYGSNIGALTEWNGGPLSYKIAFVGDFDFGQVGFVGGSTDALGLGYLYNDPSNTLVRNTRGTQFRPTFFKNTSMQTGVTGLGVYATVADMLYVAVGQFVSNAGMNPANGGTLSGAALDFLTWGRVALTAEVAGLDMVAGIYSVSGSQNKNAAVGIAKETTTGVDLQLQGDLGGVSVGLYGVYQFTGKRWATVGAAAPASNFTGFHGNVNVSLGHFGVKAGYSSSKDKQAGGAAAKTALAGVWYSLAQNVELDVEYETTSGGGLKQTTVLLEYVY